MSGNNRIDKAWDKAKPIRGKNPDSWRKDTHGNTIRKASYGTEGKFGWELDHKNPKSKGGTDSAWNIQPLHWKENRKKGDSYPYEKK